MRGIGSLILVSCLLAALPAASARATTFPVNSTADDTDLTPGDSVCSTELGACTLRAAVQEANALDGADIIELPPGTYSLDNTGIDENAAASGDLDLLAAAGLPQSLTINGAGARSTI